MKIPEANFQRSSKWVCLLLGKPCLASIWRWVTAVAATGMETGLGPAHQPHAALLYTGSHTRVSTARRLVIAGFCPGIDVVRFHQSLRAAICLLCLVLLKTSATKWRNCSTQVRFRRATSSSPFTNSGPSCSSLSVSYLHRPTTIWTMKP